MTKRRTLVKCAWGSFLVMMLCVVGYGCSSKPQLQEISQQTQPEMKAEPTKEILKSEQIPLQILEVAVSPTSFNPTKGEAVEISYKLSKDAMVTFSIFDPDDGLVKTLITDEAKPSGVNTQIWGGKDTDGNIVPDQAYFFTIEAKDESGQTAMYDPTTFSGGEEFDITDVRLDREANTLSFRLPQPAWVLGRAGTHRGPLLKNLIDWEPRPAGENTVFWNSKDESGIVNIVDLNEFSMMITTMNLPENSVITIGNNSIRYREYKEQIASGWPLKTEQTELPREEMVKLSTHCKFPRWKDKSPKFTVSFPNVTKNTEDGAPIMQGKTLLKVGIDEQDKQFVTEQRFEIAFYVDYQLYAEEEEGYTPFSWMWDTSNIPNGEHILTVNVITLNDQIGTASLKFMVENESGE